MCILLQKVIKRFSLREPRLHSCKSIEASKRLDTGRLSPAPKTRGLFSKKKKTTKPSNKYNPYAEDKVGKGTEPTGMFSMDQVQYNRANPEARSAAWAEDDRAGMTSQSNQRSSGSKPPPLMLEAILTKEDILQQTTTLGFLKTTKEVSERDQAIEQ